MKKSLFWLLIVVLTVLMIVTFSLAGCKKTTRKGYPYFIYITGRSKRVIQEICSNPYV